MVVVSDTEVDGDHGAMDGEVHGEDMAAVGGKPSFKTL